MELLVVFFKTYYSKILQFFSDTAKAFRSHIIHNAFDIQVTLTDTLKTMLMHKHAIDKGILN